MRAFKKTLIGVAAATCLGFGMASHAVTVVPFGGANFSVNAVGSGTSFQFTYTADFSGITPPSSSTSWWDSYAAGVSLDFGEGQISAASLQNPASTAGGVWTFFIDKLNSNGCTGSSNDAICAYETGDILTNLTKLNGQTLQWYFDVTFSSAAAATAFFASEHNLKFLATTGELDKDGNWVKRWDLVSENVTITCCKRPPDEVPEPGTLALLGLGLLGLGLSRRKA